MGADEEGVANLYRYRDVSMKVSRLFHRLHIYGLIAALAVCGFHGAMAGADEVSQMVPGGYRDSFNHLSKEAPDLDRKILAMGLRAFATAKYKGEAKRERLTVIDYSLPSSRKRLWVIDLERQKVLFYEFVAHGKNSGELLTEKFSNVEGSRKTSLGTFLTAETYTGKHGYSLRLNGLESGINHRARERLIVFHGADYVSSQFVARQGRLGRSWGCPAVSKVVARPLIEAIKEGSIVFAYYPDPVLEIGSAYLNSRDNTVAGSPG